MINRALDVANRHLSWITLFFGGSVISVVSGLFGWVATQVPWLSAYGPIVWLAFGAFGAILAVAVAVGTAYARYKWVEATAIRGWREKAHPVNPLEAEFHKKRIDIGTFAHPVTQFIERKRFTDCELLGPATIAFAGQVWISGTAFIGCDLVAVRPGGAKLRNVVGLSNVSIVGGSISRCTIYIPQEKIEGLDVEGLQFVSLTGIERLDKVEAT